MSTFHAVCPQCLTVNAVRTDKLEANPVCAKCATTLLPKTPVILTDESFTRFSSRSSLPLVVDFWHHGVVPAK